MHRRGHMSESEVFVCHDGFITLDILSNWWCNPNAHDTQKFMG
jgi:hypothetical protein